MAKRKRVKVEDVFIIPVDNEKNCYGQVVSDGIDKCYVIYDITSEDILIPEQVICNPIAFLTFTVDNFIEEGRWKVIGNVDVPQNIIFPIYKVETLNGYMVTDHKGNYLRSATDKEIRELKYHKSVSPALLEHAVQAKYGNRKWENYFDEIIYKEEK
ncbi:Imm26 family immunity protein [Clostridium aciditolerans]|uniref:Uncharacterized protein n=1 Tax=Clostridium aciditolerans TaxID=339861 RepID=A0A934HUT8_9CLOT|nr:Imm26 family immunity protein [Clostridium aciditolerans]MBI6871794.1 hypothetical protein [Clostridium aciditolerans]